MTSGDKDFTEYKNCRLCPRKCGLDRTVATAFCREKSDLHVSRAALHMWEEPCISGNNGSGTVFFSGCNMGCVFCQNKAISRGQVGKYISVDRLVDIFFELEDKGANNINLVTGDMFVPTIRVAIEKARNRGIGIPFLFNTSSYLELQTVKSLDGLIDIYLPDFKYIREEDAVRYSKAHGYVDAAKRAIDEMVRQCPECIFEREKRLDVSNAIEPQKDTTNDTEIMKKGVVVRHLLMPGMLIQAKMIVRYLYEKYGDSIYISLMNQFTPNGELSEYPEIDRKVSDRDYDSLIDYAAQIGVVNGFMQVGETSKESFIPEFDCYGV
ncbi:radical SAM protein [Butyrivibrio sp. VCB2006]|uniref:radical SAM protein n=1 Tax=Butyrivibrio sp. VCB2006 TaxID=1280679 RepID=UPI0003FC96BD|nr:radical SAM protein [Butyrivibrio sp. VCB2006]